MLSSLHTSVFKTFNKKKLTSPLLNYIKHNTSRFGSAIRYYPLTLGNTLASSFLITAVVVVFISIFISVIENCIFYEFFMYHYEFLCIFFEYTKRCIQKPYILPFFNSPILVSDLSYVWK